MAVNNLTTEQSYAFLNALQAEAIGTNAAVTVVDSATFTTVGQMVLKTGYDNVMSSISKVLGKTIFAVRPYTARFKGIRMDSERFGAITRKINFIDSALETDDRTPLTDGQSVDQWRINKPKTAEFNFYGETEYQRSVTIFKDQLDTAFQNEAQFGSFIGGVMQNVADTLEQIEEDQARGVLINFIGGKVKAQNGVINVLQEYYNETGTTLTPSTMYNPNNYITFVKWLYSYINTLTDRLEERSNLYHVNVTNKEIMRHTPANRLKAYMYAGVLNKIDSTVLSTVFNPDKLKMIDFEKVNFWQNINAPTSIYTKATWLKTDGTLDTDSTGTQTDNVLGVLFDEDAMGITRMSTWMQATNMNARGGYFNIFYHFRQRTFNDFSENGIVLIADTVTP